MTAHKFGIKSLLVLLVIVVLGAALTYYPHINYHFPLHVDEWYHITIAKSIAKTGVAPHIDPYTGYLPLIDLESGYHYLLALMILIFKPSIAFWTYIPTVLEVIAVISVFFFVDLLLGRKEALIAALLIALIPTNVTIGGPVLLIPENLALIFIPIALVFAFRLTKIKHLYNYIGLFVITAFLLYAHPPTAIVLLLILFFYALLLLFSKIKLESKHAKYLLLIMVLALIVSIPNYLQELQSHGINSLSFSSQILVAPLPLIYGILQTVFFIIAIYLFSKQKNKEIWSLIIVALFLFLIIFLYTNFNFNVLIPYQRAFIPLFLLMSIIASYGYAYLLKIKSHKLVLYIIFSMLIIATAYFSIYNDITTPFYHLITLQDFQNFQYIKNNLNNSNITIMDPYMARAFTPITGMKVYVVEPFGASVRYNELLNNTATFFADNCTNTKFLEENNISIVYTAISCINANLTKIINDTYVLNRS